MAAKALHSRHKVGGKGLIQRAVVPHNGINEDKTGRKSLGEGDNALDLLHAAEEAAVDGVKGEGEPRKMVGDLVHFSVEVAEIESLKAICLGG